MHLPSDAEVGQKSATNATSHVPGGVRARLGWSRGIVLLSEWLYVAEAEVVPPDGGPNTPPFGELESSNGVHECLRRDVDVQRQLAHFITGFGNISDAISSYCHGKPCQRPFCQKAGHGAPSEAGI